MVSAQMHLHADQCERMCKVITMIKSVLRLTNARSHQTFLHELHRLGVRLLIYYVNNFMINIVIEHVYEPPESDFSDSMILPTPCTTKDSLHFMHNWFKHTWTLMSVCASISLRKTWLLRHHCTDTHCDHTNYQLNSIERRKKHLCCITRSVVFSTHLTADK